MVSLNLTPPGVMITYHVINGYRVDSYEVTEVIFVWSVIPVPRNNVKWGVGL
jgi:hypothetical protein